MMNSIIDGIVRFNSCNEISWNDLSTWSRENLKLMTLIVETCPDELVDKRHAAHWYQVLPTL